MSLEVQQNLALLPCDIEILRVIASLSFSLHCHWISPIAEQTKTQIAVWLTCWTFPSRVGFQSGCHLSELSVSKDI